MVDGGELKVLTVDCNGASAMRECKEWSVESMNMYAINSTKYM